MMSILQRKHAHTGRPDRELLTENSAQISPQKASTLNHKGFLPLLSTSISVLDILQTATRTNSLPCH